MENDDFIPNWLKEAPHAPIFRVRDTRHKYGRYDPHPKTITVADLIKFHGHLCGGLMEAAVALRAAFDVLFGAEPIDRTDLEIVGNNSACGGDVAAYLTGARVRFGSQVIDPSLKGGEFYLRRVSTGEVVHVRLREAVYPHEVKAQMRRVLSVERNPADIDRFGKLQWAYARRLCEMHPEEAFLVERISAYAWPPPNVTGLGRRSDNDFKSAS